MFGALTDENYARIKEQNKRTISLVIGNPPYNANQINENDNNKNRKYPKIDSRIKHTYVARSNAQKTKLYDMYVRFFRWASDRIRDAGIVAFITNRSFIDARNFDGFRRVVSGDFDEVYIIDLGGDWKKKGRGSGGNVFGIGTGVAIGFWVRRRHRDARTAKIHYALAPEGTGEEKLAWLEDLNSDGRSLKDIAFEQIEPENGYWVDNPKISFGSEIPIASKAVKLGKSGFGDRALFKLFSLGIATNRDEWAYDLDRETLSRKVRHFIRFYENERKRWLDDGRPKDITNWVHREIKWTSELEEHLRKQKKLCFDAERIRLASYRPFCEMYTYYDHAITHRPYQQDHIFPVTGKHDNTCIVFTVPSSQKPWMVSAVRHLPDLHYVGAGAGTVCLPRFQYIDGSEIDNIPNWALNEFRKFYVTDERRDQISKDAIFKYVYGVLHNPSYRSKYAEVLKREFPRIPFYKNFWRWANWGEELLNLHLGYASVDPWPLKRIDWEDSASRRAGLPPNAILKADKSEGSIFLNGETKLIGVPAVAWDYKLGVRSALEWVLDQYSEGILRDKNVREKFDTYRFSDHKKRVIDLICRVTRVSVEYRQRYGENIELVFAAFDYSEALAAFRCAWRRLWRDRSERGVNQFAD